MTAPPQRQYARSGIRWPRAGATLASSSGRGCRKRRCHVLDLAAGAGDQTLDIAERVGPQGYVLATDLSPDILKFAAQQAAAAGYRNIETRVSDDERLQVKDAQFDAAVCRLGLMLFNDPLQGLREIARVLKPDGGVCTIVFGAPQAVTAVMSTALRHAGLPPRDPYQSGGLLSLGKPDTPMTSELARTMKPCGVRIMASMSAVSQTRPGRASSRSGHVRYAAESGSKFRALVTQRRANEG